MNIEERKLEIYPSAEVPGNEEGKNSNKETNQGGVGASLRVVLFCRITSLGMIF